MILCVWFCHVFIGLVRSRVFALQDICAFLGVQSSPLRGQCLAWPTASGVCSVLAHAHQVLYINKMFLSFFWFLKFPVISLKMSFFFYLGFYCPEGAEQAQLCPANTVRSFAGAVSLKDCLPCPPQFWCKPGKLMARMLEKFSLQSKM